MIEDFRHLSPKVVAYVERQAALLEADWNEGMEPIVAACLRGLVPEIVLAVEKFSLTMVDRYARLSWILIGKEEGVSEFEDRVNTLIQENLKPRIRSIGEEYKCAAKADGIVLLLATRVLWWRGQAIRKLAEKRHSDVGGGQETGLADHEENLPAKITPASDFGKNLSLLRKRLKLGGQKRLSEFLGIARSLLQHHENGRYEPKTETLDKYAAGLTELCAPKFRKPTAISVLVLLKDHDSFVGWLKINGINVVSSKQP